MEFSGLVEEILALSVWNIHVTEVSDVLLYKDRLSFAMNLPVDGEDVEIRHHEGFVVVPRNENGMFRASRQVLNYGWIAQVNDWVVGGEDYA